MMTRSRTRRLSRRPGASRSAGRAPTPGISRAVFFGLLLGSLGLTLRLLFPYLHSIILALLLASFFWPLHQRMLRRLGGRSNLAAALSVLLVLLVVVVPSSLFTSALIKQGIDTIRRANEWVASGQMAATLRSERTRAFLDSAVPTRALQLLERLGGGAEENDSATTGAAWISAVLPAVSKKALEVAGNRILPVLSATWSFVVGFMIMLFVLFFAFRDGHDMLAYLRHLSPLSRSQEDALIARIQDTTKAVVLGTLATAVAQGGMAMIAFKFVGIPVLFWGTMLGAASIVPVVGTALVWVPAVGYLLIIGKVGSAVFLTIWCVTIVGSVDNLLRPYLMGGRVGMSAVVVFFAIIGGIQAFGPAGILYGPLVFGLCAVCLYIYELENTAFLDQQERR